MVSLQTVRANNTSLKTLGPGLVAVFGMFSFLSPYAIGTSVMIAHLFRLEFLVNSILRHISNCGEIYGRLLTRETVGGTSGIGESTAREFVRHTLAPRVYLVGRSEAQASSIISELNKLNPDGKIYFVKSDISLLRGVDTVCDEIKSKESRVNLLFLSAGMMTSKGRDGMIFQYYPVLNSHVLCFIIGTYRFPRGALHFVPLRHLLIFSRSLFICLTLQHYTPCCSLTLGAFRETERVLAKDSIV